MSNGLTKGRLIQQKQGYKSDGIPDFENGEFGLVLDEGQEELYIGSNSGNIQVITERNIAQLAVPDGSIGRAELDGEINTLLDSIGSVDDIPLVTTTKKGLMSSNDKVKLNSIETGATNTIIVNNLTSLSTTSALSAYQGKLLKDMIDAVGSGGSTVAVVNNLTSTDTASALSANQGRVLKGLIDNKADKTTATTSANGLMSASDKQKLDGLSSGGGVTVVNTLTSTSTTSALSAYQGKVLNDTKLTGYQYSVTRSPTSNALGYFTTANGLNSFAEGRETTASGDYSHAEGNNSLASGECSHAEGWATEASGNYSHAQGWFTTASGDTSHAQGSNTVASGRYSMAVNFYTTASGINSMAGGQRTISSGVMSFAHGTRTEAVNYSSVALGHASNMTLTNSETYNSTADAFVIGNGNSSDTQGVISRSNAFRVKFNGSVYGRSAYNSSGADYAEYFEWLDGNVDNEDRVGYFVTLDGEKIRKANSTDTYILGIISANPSVVGNVFSEGWQAQYVRDEFDRVQYHYVDVEHEELDENGNKNVVIKNEYHPKYNPEYNSTTPYISREDRPEWDAVGIVGQLLVRDDGTCKVNGFAKVGNVDGEATHSDEPTNYRVIERRSENIIKVFIK